MEYITKDLMEIQQKLKAPKNQYNSFGKYKYRSCEDILEAVKPLLAKKGLTITMNDDIEAIGDRIYVKSTVTLSDGNGASFSVHAYAREDETKKGMDGAQITGASSSYARKYALSGMFAIDDTKDSDGYVSETVPTPTKTADPELKAVKEEFAATMKNHNLNGIAICNQFGIGNKPTAEQLLIALEAVAVAIETGNIPEKWRNK